MEGFLPGGLVIVADSRGVKSDVIGSWRGPLMGGFGDGGISVLEMAVGIGVKFFLSDGVVLGKG